MRDWPAIVTVVDMVWGTVLSGSVAYLSYQVSSRFGRTVADRLGLWWRLRTRPFKPDRRLHI